MIVPSRILCGRKRVGRSPHAATLGLLLLLGAPPADAQPLSAYRSQHLAWFAKAFGVPPTAVSDLRAIDVENVPTSLGLFVGFIQKGAFKMAAILPLWRCQGGAFCWKPEILGTGTRILVSEVSDLAARTARLGPALPYVRRLAPGRRPTWPAVLIRQEGQRDGVSTADLTVLSLKAPAEILLSRFAAHRGGEGGFETKWVQVERGAQGQPELVITQQSELTKSRARCLRPAPATRRYRLLRGRFQEVQSTIARPVTGCP